MCLFQGASLGNPTPVSTTDRTQPTTSAVPVFPKRGGARGGPGLQRPTPQLANRVVRRAGLRGHGGWPWREGPAPSTRPPRRRRHPCPLLRGGLTAPGVTPGARGRAPDTRTAAAGGVERRRPLPPAPTHPHPVGGKPRGGGGGCATRARGAARETKRSREQPPRGVTARPPASPPRGHSASQGGERADSRGPAGPAGPATSCQAVPGNPHPKRASGPTGAQGSFKTAAARLAPAEPPGTQPRGRRRPRASPELGPLA